MILNFSNIRAEKSLMLPQRATLNSAGYDMFAPNDVWIEPGRQLVVPMNVKWAPALHPDAHGTHQLGQTNTIVDAKFGVLHCGGFFAKIWDKSGLAVKMRFNTRAGVIDSDYPDEWGLVCVNEDDVVFQVAAGRAICQFVLLPFLVAEDCLNPLAKVRTGGFGSTGV